MNNRFLLRIKEVLTWRYQKEEFQKQGATKGVQMSGSLMRRSLLNAPNAAN